MLFTLIPDENTEEFQTTIQKISTKGIDATDPSCFVNEDPDRNTVDLSIKEWLSNIKILTEEGKDTEHERANVYYLPDFYNHLSRVALEFVLWSAVVRPFFKSTQIRATSCFVEGDFGELKNNVLKGVYRALRADKLFLIHFEALRGQVRIASAAITSFYMDQESKKSLHHLKDENNKSTLESDVFPRMYENESSIPIARSSLINPESKLSTTKSDFQGADCIVLDPENESQHFPVNPELYEKENWRNMGEKNDVVLTGNVIFSDLDSHQTNVEKRSLTDFVPSKIPSKPGLSQNSELRTRRRKSNTL